MTACPTTGSLVDLLVGALPPPDRDALRAHIVGCAHCQATLDRLTDRFELDLWRSSLSRRGGEPEDEPALRRLIADLRTLPVDEGEGEPSPDEGSAPTAVVLGPPREPGDLGALGPYRVEAELGRGGMGIVYRAYDPILKRRVALKVLRAELADDRSRRRLIREAQVVAQFRHDHLVTVYSVVDPPAGRPYLVMEYLEGPSLAQRTAREGRLAPRPAATMIAQVAEGLAVAHAGGLVHRDIKPSNILIDPATDRAKLTDFGIAGGIGAGTLTQEDILAGTPTYMSPEQVRGEGPLDGRSDVYSLGATLYESLTGEPPFRGAPHVVLRRVLEDEPRPPRSLCPSIPPDLETICRKAMAKDPAHRYPSARALADDLYRFLDGRPIAARRAGRWERALLWARRRPAVAALLAAVVVVGCLGLVLTSWQWYRAETALRHQRQRADAEAEVRREAQRTSATLALAKAESLGEQGRREEALLWLAEGLRIAPDDAAPLRRALRSHWSHWRPQLRLVQCLPHEFAVEFLDFHPDGRRVVSTDAYSGRAQIWDFARGRLLHTLEHPGEHLTAVAFDPRGRLVATAVGQGEGRVELWDAETGRPSGEPLRPGGPVRTAAFSPDGTRLATVVNPGGRVQLWDVATRERIGPGWSAPGVFVLAFFPDNRTVATGGYAWESARRDAETGAEVGAPLHHPAGVGAVAVSPDGRTYLTGCDDQRARLVDAATGRQLAESPLLPDRFLGLAFRPDGRQFLSGTSDGVARLWDTASFRPIDRTGSHPGGVLAVAFAPDGTTFATGSRDGDLRIWSVTPGEPFGAPFGPRLPGPGNALVAGPGGRMVVCQSGDDQVLRLDAATGRPIGPPTPGAWWLPPIPSGDGETFLLQPERGALRLWRPRSGTFLPASIPYDREDRKSQPVALSPDGRTVATIEAVWGRTARLWEAATGRPIGPPLEHPRSVFTAAFTTDGKILLTGGQASVWLWDAATGKSLGDPMPQGARQVLVVSPDGRRLLASGSWDGQSHPFAAQLWDLARRRRVGPPLAHRAPVLTAAFRPDGRALATGALDKTARVWDAATGQPLSPPMPHDGPVESLAFSPDGQALLTVSLDGKVRLWEPTCGQLLCPPLGNGGRILAAAFHPNGRTVLTAGEDRQVRQWKIPMPAAGTPAEILARTRRLTGIGLDASGLAFTLSGSEWANLPEP